MRKNKSLKSPESVSDLVGRWGTIKRFAASVGCGYEAARKMRARDSIDNKHWPKVITAASAEGIEGATLEWLVSHHADRPPLSR